VRVLVTGAGGFVGSYLVPYLVSAGHEVVGSSLEPPPAGRFPVPWEVFDLTDAEAVAGCVARIRPEGIVHLAAQASVGGSWADPQGTYRANIEGTGNLLEAVKSLRPRVLLVGSAQQYRPSPDGGALSETDPQLAGSPYALTKIAQEQMGLMYLQHDGIPAVLTRSFNHTGPGQSSAYAVGSFASQIARLERVGGGDMHVGSLDSRRDFCDVRDVVKAYARLLEAGEPGEVYNVCSGQSVRMGDVLGRLLEVAGLAGKVQVHEQTLDASAAPNHLVGDPSKIRAAVGWSPEIPLDRSLIETLDWYRSLSEDEA
jgi:GDP-4-dehydro-6-deoxy-D-mannose reductase